MRALLLLFSLLLVGCATPKTVEEKIREIKEQDDYSLCYDVAMNNLTSGFEVNELKLRKVNCGDYAGLIKENRLKQIQTANLYAGLSDAFGGRPINNNKYPTVLPTWFPDFSGGRDPELTLADIVALQTETRPQPSQPQTPIILQTTSEPLRLTTVTKNSDGSWLCTYGVGVNQKRTTVAENQICPISY